MKSQRVLLGLLAVIAAGVVVIAVVLVALLAGGDDEEHPDVSAETTTTDDPGLLEPYPYDSIDVDAWHEDLHAAGAEIGMDKMPRLYEIVADRCDDSLSELVEGESVPGSDPETSRIDFGYVCPSSLPLLEQALVLAE